MMRIITTIFFIVLLFFIVSYANSHDIPKLLSNAQEAFSNLIGGAGNKENNLPPPVALVLTNPIFAPGENIILQYDGEAQSFKDLNFDLKNSADKPVSMKVTLKEDKFGKSIQIETSKKMSLGKYRLVIKQAQQELINKDVYLGTIVINNQQSQYKAGENYISDMVFLDNKGRLLCMSNPSFSIINTISGASDALPIKEGKCDEKNSSPYRLSYTPKTTGTYILKNTQGETSGSLIPPSAFDVLDTASPISLKREGPTFVNSSGSYEMKITISADENFEGTVTDLIPAGFVVINSSNFSLQPSIVSFDESSIHIRKPFAGEAPVTLGFGDNPDSPALADAYKNYGVKAHDGIDFGLPDNTPVLAVDDGKIIDFPSKLLANYGTTIVLEHLWGGRTFYGHLSKINVQVGQMVGKGDVIGFSGETGLTTGPHLHFGLDLKNSDVNNGYLGKIDPSPYLSDSNKLNASTQKLSWTVAINKGEKKELGYDFTLPKDDYGYSYYKLGPIDVVNKDATVVFKDNKRWTLIKQ